jgi:hypothetical protein
VSDFHKFENYFGEFSIDFENDKIKNMFAEEFLKKKEEGCAKLFFESCVYSVCNKYYNSNSTYIKDEYNENKFEERLDCHRMYVTGLFEKIVLYLIEHK